MAIKESCSRTPILDLLEPLPDPDSERPTGRFALPFLTFAAFFVITQNFVALGILLSFLVVNFLVIAIHECGHLIAGWSAGLQFKGVRIDPFRLRIDSGIWKFKLRPRLFWGFARMSLKRLSRVRRRLLIFIAGGPTASIVCGATAAILGEIGLAHYYDSPWPTLLEFFGVWSFLIGCIGLIPFKARGHASDGMLLRVLVFWKPEATQMIASYGLSTLNSGTVRQPNYYCRWFRLAAIPTKLQDDNYCASWLAYEAARDEESAALFLERCLAASALMDESERDLLAVEATVFTACRRNDAVKADLWSKKIQSLNRVHPVWRARLKIALLYVHERFEEAYSELSQTLPLIREAEHQKLETAWITWGEHIRARIPVRTF